MGVLKRKARRGGSLDSCPRHNERTPEPVRLPTSRKGQRALRAVDSRFGSPPRQLEPVGLRHYDRYSWVRRFGPTASRRRAGRLWQVNDSKATAG